MSCVSGRVSVPQRRDAREAIYEPPDRSLWPLGLSVHLFLLHEKRKLLCACELLALFLLLRGALCK